MRLWSHTPPLSPRPSSGDTHTGIAGVHLHSHTTLRTTLNVHQRSKRAVLSHYVGAGTLTPTRNAHLQQTNVPYVADSTVQKYSVAPASQPSHYCPGLARFPAAVTIPGGDFEAKRRSAAIRRRFASKSPLHPPPRHPRALVSRERVASTNHWPPPAFKSGDRDSRLRLWSRAATVIQGNRFRAAAMVCGGRSRPKRLVRYHRRHSLLRSDCTHSRLRLLHPSGVHSS